MHADGFLNKPIDARKPQGQKELPHENTHDAVPGTGNVCGARFLPWCSLPTSAQVDSGGIRGTVKDRSGAVVSGAKVTLTNEDTSLATGNQHFR